MEILLSELLLLFEVSLAWVEVVADGLLLIVVSVEEISDVLFSSLAVGDSEAFSVTWLEDVFAGGALL